MTATEKPCKDCCVDEECDWAADRDYDGTDYEGLCQHHRNQVMEEYHADISYDQTREATDHQAVRRSDSRAVGMNWSLLDNWWVKGTLIAVVILVALVTGYLADELDHLERFVAKLGWLFG